MADKNFRVKNGLEVGGTEIDIAQGTTIEYSENNDRANRPVVKSTTGNTSGLRVEAPNATTSAVSVVSVFSTNDGDNGKFVGIQARGGTNPLRIQSGEYTAGVLSPAGDAVAFIDGGTLYATVNPAGVVNNTDLATKLYVDSQVDSNTTYTIDATSTTGGANFNLVGSDSTTDSIKFGGSGATTVTRTDANTITISSTDTNTTYTQDASSTTGGANLNLVGSDSTTDSVKFANGTNVTVTATDANTITIAATDTNTTYTQDASSTTGGANLNLVGSDSTTDSVKFAGGTNVTVTATDANTITIAATDTNTTYTIDASSTTGGANLNLVGSDASTDTVKFAEGTGIDVVQTDANTITTSLNAVLDDLNNVDNTTTALAAGQQFYYNGTNWVNSVNVDSPNLNRFLRTNTGTASNAILAISRNRGDAARAVDGGPWLGFEYVGTDNTQGTAPQNAIRSRYQTSGDHQLQFLQLPGNYTSPTVIGQVQRGSHFLNSTTGYNILNLTDTLSATRANTITLANSGNTTTYATFASSGASIGGVDGVSTFTRASGTTAGTRPVLVLRNGQTATAAPSTGDGTSFRVSVNGSNNTIYQLAQFSGVYSSTGDTAFNVDIANGDQTGAIMTVVQPMTVKLSETRIRATATPTATAGGNTLSDVAVFNTTKIDAKVPIQYPSYTTTERNALTPSAGWVLFNSTDVKLQCYDGSNWQNLF